MAASAGSRERRALQVTVAAASLVPICAGLAGMLWGARMFDPAAASIDLDSHVRYLSGILLAIGIAFAAMVPRIERHRSRFGLLAALVVLGGIGRLMAALWMGMPSTPMVAALGMELLVTPALAVWQRRVSRAA